MKTLKEKIDFAIKLIQSAAAKAKEVGQPIEVCYSGGKDSDVILELVRMAKVEYRAIYKNTTIDPPGTIKHSRERGVEIMKKREITATGMINNNGGLQMYMGELNQFFAMHKGSRIIARFIVASPGSSEALKGYYFNYVVPTFRTGIWEAGERLTEEQTERRLRELSPVMYEQTPDINTGKYETRLRTIAELSNTELIEHIEHLKQIAAEEYNTFIDDPRSI